MTKSELMVENRQLKKKVADLECLHADAVENWKDEMEGNTRLKADLGRKMAIANEYLSQVIALEARVRFLESGADG